MKPRASLATRLAIGLSGLGGVAWASGAFAQTAAPPSAVPWSAANLPGTAVYQDRYIGGGSLTPDISAGEATSSDSEGLARSVQVDAVMSRLTSSQGGSSTSFTENGIVAKSQWETAAYGTWSLDASARTGGNDSQLESGQGGVVTLEAARHALRWGLVGRQCARRPELPGHRSGAICSRASICRPAPCRV